MNERDKGGKIFNIQKYSVHDGPGIRTIVFFKGCPLRCAWCSNPESQSPIFDLAFNATRCIGIEKCGHCISACPQEAISRDENNFPVINRKVCDRADCGHMCVPVCHSGALTLFGRFANVADIMAEVEKDEVFYQRCQGGLTVSGGEPLAQPDFLLALLREASDRYMNTTIETCGMGEYATLREVAPLLDNLIFDIKHLDPKIHRRYTGQSNETIVANLCNVAEDFPGLPILVRTPVVPDFNDSAGHIEAICEFLATLPHSGRISYELLPYHRLGSQKYRQLDRHYQLGEMRLDKKLFGNLLDKARKIMGERLVN